MNNRQKIADGLLVAIRNYSGSLSDKEIAAKYKISVERVKKARQRLGIKKAGYRHHVV